ncbi:hypothetical protein ONZ45_g13946 [Pleurotus djamor]|nr:hypothetical protein ONZ45_g13946 [Pleurotus djamor]
MFSLVLVALAFVTAAFAAPAQADASCNISNAVLKLPAGQTGLVPPSGKPSFIAGAIGVQNYTCSDAGTFTSVGAVAELVDISCLFGTDAFDVIQDRWFLIWSVLPPGTPPLATIGNPEPLGEHFFITNPVTGTGLSPKWDFTSHGATRGNRNAFVVGARSGGIPSPSGSANVDWLSLSNVQGRLANQVFRVDTKGGQPPASCRPGTSISVKYTSKYWFFGSTL